MFLKKNEVTQFLTTSFAIKNDLPKGYKQLGIFVSSNASFKLINYGLKVERILVLLFLSFSLVFMVFANISLHHKNLLAVILSFVVVNMKSAIFCVLILFQSTISTNNKEFLLLSNVIIRQAAAMFWLSLLSLWVFLIRKNIF